MSEIREKDREDRLLTILAKPLTRLILSILFGLDPGRMSEDILEEMMSNSHDLSNEEFEHLENDDN